MSNMIKFEKVCGERCQVCGVSSADTDLWKFGPESQLTYPLIVCGSDLLKLAKGIRLVVDNDLNTLVI